MQRFRKFFFKYTNVYNNMQFYTEFSNKNTYINDQFEESKTF